MSHQDDSDRLRVELGARSYDVVVGAGLLERDDIFANFESGFAAIITDDNVAPLHLERLQSALSRNRIDHNSMIIPHGESSKSFERLQTVCDGLLDMRLDRRAVVLAFGGGVVGDLAGFAASIVLRGLRCIQLPTTLLAQVDSAVGGKTGINTGHGKNLIGTFHQPSLVISDLDCLDTLPQRELLAGYAEVVKYGLIVDADFFVWLENNGVAVCSGDKDKQREAILRSCRAKAQIVAEDERESGRRALLNLGHTFGHAFEAAAGYGESLLHGEAVSIGMVMAFDLAARMGLCPEDDGLRMKRHLTSVGLPTVLPRSIAKRLKSDRLLDIMASDKKNRDGIVRFILPRKIGDAFVSDDVALHLVHSSIEEALAA